MEAGICVCCGLNLNRYPFLGVFGDTDFGMERIPDCEDIFVERGEDKLSVGELLNKFIDLGHKIQFRDHESCSCKECGLSYSWDEEDIHTSWFSTGPLEGKMIENHDTLTCNEIIIKSLLE